MKIFHSLIITAGLVLLGLSACIPLSEDIIPPPGSEISYQSLPTQPEPGPVLTGGYPLVAPNPLAGKAIYAEKCAPCHGETGLGNGPEAEDLPNPVAPIGDPGLARQRTPSDWFAQVTNGNIAKYMPPFISLTDQQRWDVVAYAFTLSQDPESIAAVEETYLQACAACHESDDAPRFTDQERMAKRSAVDLFASLAHPGVEAANFEAALPEDQRWALAAYVRQISFGVSGEMIANGESIPETAADDPAASPADSSETTELENAQDPSLPVSGAITGQLLSAMGTPLPLALEVKLYAYDHIQEAFTLSEMTAEDGSFTFENIEMLEGRAFLVAVDYQRTTFTSDIGLADPASGVIDLPVSIFETSSDASLLNVDRLHIFFEQVSPETIRVAQLIIISNPSDQVIVPVVEGQPVINIDIPAEATNLQIQDGIVGDRFVLTADGFGDTRGIYPGAGQYQLLYSFDLPFEKKVTLDQKLFLGVTEVIALLPDDSLRLSGDQFVSQGTTDVQGVPYALFSASGLSAGSALSLTLSGPSGLASAFSSLNEGSNLMIGIGALIIVGTLAFLWLRRPNGEIPFAGISPAAAPDADSLMDDIIALDDRYQAGDLPEEGYLRRRAALKEQLNRALGGETE